MRNMRVVVNPTYWTGNVVGHSISLSAINTAKALSTLPKRRMMQLLGYEDTLNKTGLPIFERKV